MKTTLAPTATREPSCDCHVHVFDPERFPYVANRAYTPGVASVAALQELHQRLGLTRVVLVQPSVYGTDNRCMLAAIKELGQDRARGIAVVDLDTIADDELSRLHEGGVRGVRLNLHVADHGLQAAERQVQAARRLRRLPGLHLQVHASLQVHAALLEHYRALDVPVVLDHFAGGVRPGDEARWQELLDALRHPQLYVKLSAAYRLPSGNDASVLIRALAEAAPTQMVWGSDWPHTGGSGGQGRQPQAIEPFRDIDNASALLQLTQALGHEQAARQVLVDNPAQLYGF